jgi:YTV
MLRKFRSPFVIRPINFLGWILGGDNVANRYNRNHPCLHWWGIRESFSKLIDGKVRVNSLGRVCGELAIFASPRRRNLSYPPENLLELFVMKWMNQFLCSGLATVAIATTAFAGDCVPCGGCSDPCGSASGSAIVAGAGCGVVADASVSTGCAVAAAPASESVCEPVTTYKVVMEPKYVTETRAVQSTETRTETRQRTKKVYTSVPVTETRYRTKTVNVPKTETKTIEYTVLVPVKSEKTVDVTESVPVWNEVSEEYTVKVPNLVDVPETYTVQVPSLKDETFTYTVNVPHPVTEEKVRTVTNAVPVTKTREVERCVPVTTMTSVCKDYGHWEDRVEEVAAAPATAVAAAPTCGTGYTTVTVRSGLFGRRCCKVATSCGGCSSCAPACGAEASGCGSVAGGCGSDAGSCGAAAPAGCGTTTVTRKVWVPNMVTEQVPVVTSTTQKDVVSYTVFEQQTEQVPYQCTTIVYKPEVRTGTKQVVDYVSETRSRTRKQVEYKDETRTRTRKELSYNTVTKTETFPVVTYNNEKRTKEVSFTYNVPEVTQEAYDVTRYDSVCEDQVEEYTVSVPVCVMKEEQVQVCKMVPRLVEEVIHPCCDGASASGAGCAGGCGAAPAVSTGCGSAAGCGAAAPAASCGGCGAAATPASTGCGC